MKAAVNTERVELQDPAIREAVQRRMAALTDTHRAYDTKCVFQAWDTQRDQVFALVVAVRNRLAKDEDYFNDLQLLDIAENILSDTREVNRLKQVLGVDE